VSGLPIRAVPDFAAPDPRWGRQGARDVERVRRALGPLARAVYHVGATSVAGLPASPVLDLLAEIDVLERLARARLRLLAYGFEAIELRPGGEAGDYRLYVVDDMITGERRAELRCYPAGNKAAARIPALFALLRARPELALAYHEAKLAARTAHAADGAAYLAAKMAWLDRLLNEALALWRAV
jgi:GrpB-like predicted nucleotidyltransferase (UPF0157 family)